MIVDLLIYGLALGVVAVLFVPFLVGLTSKVVPSSLQANFAVLPSTYPSGGAAIIWSIALWGLFLGVSLWAISMIKPVGRAIEREA